MAHTRANALPTVLLYVPGDRPSRFAAALDAAPAIIIDLEDSVAPAHKIQARAHVAEYLHGEVSVPSRTWVRVSSETLIADLAAVPEGIGVAGVMVAKASAESVHECAIRCPDLSVIPLIEDARGLDHITQIAECETVATLAVGEVDLLADLRLRATPATAHAIDVLRLTVVRAAAAADLAAPIAPTSLQVRDNDSLVESTSHLRDLGFRSRTAIHPAQCPAIIAAFAPSESEVEQASAIVTALESAAGGVAVDAGGRLIDRAVARHAREVLQRMSISKESL